MTKAKQQEVYTFNWAPLLAYYDNSAPAKDEHLLPINVGVRVEHRAGEVQVTFGDGFQTTLDGTAGGQAELFEHLRRLLIIAGQWPSR